MPSANKHWCLCKEYIDSARLLRAKEHTRTFSLLAYYGAMHAFEAMCAAGILGGEDHFNTHHDRIAAALRNPEKFSEKMGNALFTLYDFSYKARYIQQDATTYDGDNGSPNPKRGQEIDLEKCLPRTEENVNQISTRVNKVLMKSEQLLSDKQFKFPCKIEPIELIPPTVKS